jgi:hypothetical protein
MTNKEEKEIVENVKSILPQVVNFMEEHKFADFDYGYLYSTGVWEASFFNENDEVVLYLTASNQNELVEMLDYENIAIWHNEG